MSATRVSFTAGGMVSALGHSAAASCAAIRADLCGFSELHYADNTGAPIRGAPVPDAGVPISETGPDRLWNLLAMAIADCTEGVPAQRLDGIPLLTGIAEPGRPGGLSVATAGEMLEKLGRGGLRFHPQHSRVVAAGHTSVFRALDAARSLVSSGAVAACLVAGVDSYLNAESLLWLDSHYRLKTAQNSDGVIPGEAAACVLVEPRPRQGQIGVELLGLGFGHERAGILTEEPPLQALGLTEAARGALGEAELGMHRIDFRSSDVAGEGYGFKELALSLQKLMRVRRENLPVWHPADAVGETGAAAGAVQFVIAQYAFRKGYAPGPRLLCHGSAVAGDRAVAVVEGRVG